MDALVGMVALLKVLPSEGQGLGQRGARVLRLFVWILLLLLSLERLARTGTPPGGQVDLAITSFILLVREPMLPTTVAGLLSLFAGYHSALCRSLLLCPVLAARAAISHGSLTQRTELPSPRTPVRNLQLVWFRASHQHNTRLLVLGGVRDVAPPLELIGCDV
jgi:hypothetical protein